MSVRFASWEMRAWLLASTLIVAPVLGHAQTQTHYVTLEWTAPGDDGAAEGRATQYQVRYATTPPSPTDTLGWWDGATAASGLPYPASAGETDSVRIQGLQPDVTYYFVLRTSDERPNWSGYSNVAFALPRTCLIPGAAPQSFQVVDDAGDALLSWSSTSDPSASSLRVYRASAGSGSFEPLATLDASETSYRDQPGWGTYDYQVRWVSTCGDGPLTSPSRISFIPPQTPTGPVAGIQARPNPSSGPVSIVVTVPGSSAAPVSLRLFDSTGRMTVVIADGTYQPGTTTISWPRTSTSGDRVAPGYYELIGKIGIERVRERLVLLP